jgi:hypothetical protein
MSLSLRFNNDARFVAGMAGLFIAANATMAGLNYAVGSLTETTKNCTIEQSEIYIEGRTRRSEGIEVNYIETKECGTIRNSTLFNTNYRDKFCGLVPGDTIQLKLYYNILGNSHYPGISEIGPVKKHDASLVTKYTPGPQHYKSACWKHFQAREKAGLPIPPTAF